MEGTDTIYYKKPLWRDSAVPSIALGLEKYSSEQDRQGHCCHEALFLLMLEWKLCENVLTANVIRIQWTHLPAMTIFIIGGICSKTD